MRQLHEELTSAAVWERELVQRLRKIRQLQEELTSAEVWKGQVIRGESSLEYISESPLYE